MLKPTKIPQGSPLMTSHVFWPILTYLPTLSYSITYLFWAILDPLPTLIWTSLMNVPLLLLHRDFKSFLRSCNLMQLQKKAYASRSTAHWTILIWLKTFLFSNKHREAKRLYFRFQRDKSDKIQIYFIFFIIARVILLLFPFWSFIQNLANSHHFENFDTL